MGCFRGRTEEGKRIEVRRCPFEAEAGEAGEGWGVRARPREGGIRRGSAQVRSRHVEDDMGGWRSSLCGSTREGRGQGGGSGHSRPQLGRCHGPAQSAQLQF
jgi:hypothetical protein